MKIRNNIQDRKGLQREMIALDAEIALSNANLKNKATQLIDIDLEGLGSNLAKSSAKRELDIVNDPRGKLFPTLAANLSNTLFSRLDFFKKFILTTATKMAVKRILKPQDTLKEKPNTATSIPSMSTFDKQIKQQQKAQPAIKPADASKARPGKLKLNWKGIFSILKSAFSGFSDHKVTKLSGSLAYYTVFSMAPLLVVIISLSAFFFDREAAEGQVFAQLKGFLGSDTALQLQELIKHAAIGNKSSIAFIIGIITLLLGATSIFADIQDSINSIWGIKPKPKRGWLKMLQNRFLSLSVIVSLGFLLVVSLSVSALLDGFSSRLQARFSETSVIIFYIFNIILTLGVISTIFGVIFKVLPDADIKWRDVVSGAMVTAVLFMAGKFGISFYISQSNVGGTYGAAGSLVVLLLWTYYSSIILYFGAEFTKAYALARGTQIRPNHYAVTIEEVEVEKVQQTIQQAQQ